MAGLTSGSAPPITCDVLLERLVEKMSPGIAVGPSGGQGMRPGSPRRASTAPYVTDEQRSRLGCIAAEDGRIIPISFLKDRLGVVRGSFRYDGLLWRRFAYLGSAFGPWWWRRYSPAAIGAIFWAAQHGRRRAVVANVRRILSPGSRLAEQAVAVQTFANFARCLTDCLEAAGPKPPEFTVEAVGGKLLGAALEAGHGAVMVTAHFGNWELIGRLVCRKGFPITVAMARERNSSVRPFVQWQRAQDGVEIVYTDADAFSALDMLRVLRNNRILAMQLDRPSGGDGDRIVPFFGVPTRFPLGPFVLAQAAGAPVMPVFAFLTGHHRYRVEQETTGIIPRRGGIRAAEAALHTTVRLLEAAVRRAPDQWFHFTPIGGDGWAVGPDNSSGGHEEQPSTATGRR